MFQYAVGRNLALRNHTGLILDISGFKKYPLRTYSLNSFKIQAQTFEETSTPSLSGELLKKIFFWSKSKKENTDFVNEKYFYFDPEVLNMPDGSKLSGYWQSEKYFTDIKYLIKKDFTLKKTSSGCRKWKNAIIKTQSVSIHVRRGDYVTDPTTHEYHGISTMQYYRKAISIISVKIKNPHFFIFSDDARWVETHMKLNYPYEIISEKIPLSDCEEMVLMSKCKHNIITNSTFSWWGAWLNDNSKKMVIVPKKWFTDPAINTDDLIPKAWMKI